MPENTNPTPGLAIKEYARKPFNVRAVQVTAENMAAVAAWCGGKVLEETSTLSYIKVKVHQPLDVRQTKAYIGDFVVYVKGYKVYPAKAFNNSFRENIKEAPAQVEADLVQKSREQLADEEGPTPAERLVNLETGATTLIPGNSNEASIAPGSYIAFGSGESVRNEEIDYQKVFGEA